MSEQTYVSIALDHGELCCFPVTIGNIIGFVGRLLDDRQSQDTRYINTAQDIRLTVLDRLGKGCELGERVFYNAKRFERSWVEKKVGEEKYEEVEMQGSSGHCMLSFVEVSVRATVFESARKLNVLIRTYLAAFYQSLPDLHGLFPYA